MRKALKIISSILVALILVIGASVAFICYEMDDEQLRTNVETILSDALDTEVTLNGAKLHPFSREIAIYGFNVKDRKNIDMLHVDTLELNIDLWKLWHQELKVYGVNLAGANAVLYKERKDTAANYQFVIDAMNFMGSDKQKDKHATETTKREIYLDLRKVVVSRTSARWDIFAEEPLNTPDHKQIDSNHLWVHDLNMHLSLRGGGSPGNFVGTLKDLTVDEHNSNTAITIRDLAFNGKKHTIDLSMVDFVYQDKHLTVSDLELTGDIMDTKDKHRLTIKDIAFENGIGIPKKPRPATKGAFDAKHVKLNVSLDATATCLTPDSIAMHIDRLEGTEHNSRLKIDNVSMSMERNRERNVLSNVRVLSGKNVVNIGKAVVNLPRYGNNARPMSFVIGTMTCDAMLCEIAYPFAPALSNFTTPLKAQAGVTGTTEDINFHNVKIFTPDRRLQIAANGIFRLPKHKGEKLTMAFDISSLRATGGVKDQIISHFVKTENTMKFIRNVGDIAFHGKVTLPWQRQLIQGTLNSRYGMFNVDVLLNSDTYYLTGNVKTERFRLGEYLDNSNLGDVSLYADVKMDISSKKKAKLLHRKKGKIPAGTIKGRAVEASYKGIKITNVDFNIVSDAETARGTLSATGKVMDVSCDFSFNDADIQRSLKVKPHIKMHNFIEKSAPVQFIKNLFGKKEGKNEK